MILTDREIKIAIDRGQIDVDPKPEPEAFSSTALDLTLNSKARIFKQAVGQGINFDPGATAYNFHSTIGLVTTEVRLDPTYSLSNNTLLLAWTTEKLALPVNSRLAARVEGKSALARIGMGVHITAPTIHAGFTGHLQLEIINHGPAPIILRTGMRICQIIFEVTLGTPDKGYTGLFSGQKSD